MLAYDAFKVVHLLGVVLFLGNIVVTALWKSLADRTRQPAIVAFAQRLVTVTDWAFTAGGVVLLLIGAYGMVITGGLEPFETTWLLWGQGLLIASGVIWAVALIPTQMAQSRLAREFAAGGPIPDRYWQLNRRWLVWGILATLVPMGNLYVMIFKP
jgi:uncharacterized membrane protein